jgi:hypothetical protein
VEWPIDYDHLLDSNDSTLEYGNDWVLHLAHLIQ